MSEKKTGFVGIVLVFAKIFGKVFPKLAKVAKSLFGLKALGVAASLGFYSYLLTWQMGVALVAFIFIHEYGHLYAMKKCGLKTRGIYLIPGFGGAALAGEGFKSGRNEAYIALDGPLFGLLFVACAFVAYMITAEPIFAAIAGLTAFVNFVNLFPINPLDGGRVVKSLVYSFHAAFGFIFMMISLVLAGILGVHFGWSLLSFVALIGLMEVVGDYGLSNALKNFLLTIWRIFFIWVFVAIVSVNPTETFGIVLCLFFAVVIMALFVFDAIVASQAYEKDIVFYPYLVIRQAYEGVREFFRLNVGQLFRIDGHVPMTRGEVWKYGLLYLGMIVLHLGIIVGIALLPGMAEVGHLLS